MRHQVGLGRRSTSPIFGGVGSCGGWWILGQSYTTSSPWQVSATPIFYLSPHHLTLHHLPKKLYACCFILLPTMDTCRPKASCRLYVIPRNFWFGLYLICSLLRYRAGRHLALCMFVVKKEHSDFWADSSIFHDVLQLVTAVSSNN